MSKSPFSINTPLSSFPYNSRTGVNEFDPNHPSKNYVLHGFKPGYPLQASELNEVQENYYKNLTLYNILLKNWFKIPQMLAGDSTQPIRGPSWMGAVPLHPDMIEISSGNVAMTTGWYLVDDSSGLKFWIYNNQTRSLTGAFPQGGVVGVDIERKYITAAQDSTLNDNSNGYSDSSVSSGADRFQLNFVGNLISNLEQNESPIILRRDIFQINSNRIFYLNNLLITTL